MAKYQTIKPEQLIDKFKYALDNKWGYIWGTAGALWTKKKQAELDKTTDSDRALSRKYGSKWIGRYVADCSGLFSWAFKQLNSYTPHGSNSMWNSYCKDKGNLSKGRRSDGYELKPGTAVFTYNSQKDSRGHVGLYIGNGKVIEAAGANAGVTTSSITNSKWKEWGELKYVDYSSATPAEEVNYPTLRNGDKGDKVLELQKLLNKAGCGLEEDGIFGKKTLAAVKKYQKANGLDVDGVVGPKTWEALKSSNGAVVSSTWTVILHNLSRADAEAYKSIYPSAEIVEERS